MISTKFAIIKLLLCKGDIRFFFKLYSLSNMLSPEIILKMKSSSLGSTEKLTALHEMVFLNILCCVKKFQYFSNSQYFFEFMKLFISEKMELWWKPSLTMTSFSRFSTSLSAVDKTKCYRFNSHYETSWSLWNFFQPNKKFIPNLCLSQSAFPIVTGNTR